MAIWCHQTNLTYNFKTSLEPSYQSSNDDISLLPYFRPYYISRIKTQKTWQNVAVPTLHKFKISQISKLIMASHFIFFSNSIKYYTFLHLTKLFTVTILIYNRYLQVREIQYCANTNPRELAQFKCANLNRANLDRANRKPARIWIRLRYKCILNIRTNRGLKCPTY